MLRLNSVEGYRAIAFHDGVESWKLIDNDTLVDPLNTEAIAAAIVTVPSKQPSRSGHPNGPIFDRPLSCMISICK